ncbi:MAG: YdbL family protein [candidate division Zixibacteria bacterium]|nr:YdbL family protein [candidate division Zixibacteria bacterium]
MKTIFLFIVMMTVVLASCTIKPPGVTITSEKTSLEKQLLGSFARGQNDPFTTAAVWIAQPDSLADQGTITVARAVDPEILKAQARRRLNSEDIDSLKSRGTLGEGIDGLIHFHETDSSRSDSVYRNLALLMIQAENDDRQVILNRFFKDKEIVAENIKTQLVISFAGVMARRSPDGTPVQQPDGSWEVKQGD